MLSTQTLGTSDLKVTRIAYGCMPLGGSWDTTPLNDEVARKAVISVRAALDAGINFYDHADIYCRGKSEEVFSRIWDEVPSLREKIIVQSKVGIRFSGSPNPSDPSRYDFSYEHIIGTVEGSLRRLKTDYLDVLLLHRPDALVEPEEVAKAFDELHASGKVRWFGVSNETAAQIDLLRAYVKQPIVCNQVAFNVVHTHMLSEGVNFNQDTPMLTRNHGTIEYCRLHKITLQAWAPLAGGQLTGHSTENAAPRVVKTAELVAQLAGEKNVSGEAILIAWVLRHPAKVQAIIGTTQPSRIAAACQGDGVTLTREEWYRLFIAGRGEDVA